MTENEAIKKLEPYLDGIDSDLTFMELFYKDVDRSEYLADRDAFTTAITALKEIQQYREIGTVEECREAVEKQKVKILEFYGSREDGKLLCQNCGEDLWDLRECGFNNCPYCGQAILWENLDGMEDE